ncbi:hypothetical protein EST38_g6025 [Candolleomyces aberdarensis]|uniref:Uncharacterized protein n=1 Tax=Candolleomyces aberdarensis TaxID=2316362 RepID=A0A4Q2DIL1_9AGAR|nr:hypothetical protein EST38_g6025 [Candolleomyces aberdarensis]
MDLSTVRHTVFNITTHAKDGSYIFCTKDGTDPWEVCVLVDCILIERTLTPVPLEEEDRNLIDFGEDDEEDPEIGNEELDVMIRKEMRDDEDQMAAIQGVAELVSQGRLMSLTKGSKEGPLTEWDGSEESMDGIGVPLIRATEYIQALEGITFEESNDMSVLDVCDRLLWGFDIDDGPALELSVSLDSEGHPESRDDENQADGSDFEIPEDEDEGEDEDAITLSPTTRILPPKSPQRKKYRQTITSEPTGLITTPLLSSYNLTYNVQYKLLVCLICKLGVCLDGLHYHLVGKTQMEDKEWMPGDQKYQPIKLDRHNYNLGMSKVKFIREVNKQLTQALGRAPDILATYNSMKDGSPNAWKELVKPHEHQKGRVEGLKVFEHGLVCTLPPCSNSPYAYCSLSEATMLKHCGGAKGSVHSGGPQVKKGTERWKMAPVQSFFSGPGLWAFFPVPRPNLQLLFPPLNPIVASSTSDPSQEDLLNLIEQEEADFAVEEEEMDSGALELVPPAFVEMKMVELWELISMEEARKVLSIRPVGRKSATGLTNKLTAAVSATFLSICSSVQRAHPGLLCLIGRGAALYGSPAGGRPFSIPQKQHTLNSYLLFEVQLLRHMLYSLHNPIKRKDGKDVFQFDNAQREALRNLNESLRDSKASLTEVGACVHTTLHALYFPTNPERAAFDVFEDPFSTYLSLTSLKPEGNPVPLALLPPYLSKAQFSVRLRAYHHLHEDFQQYSAQQNAETPESAAEPPCMVPLKPPSTPTSTSPSSPSSPHPRPHWNLRARTSKASGPHSDIEMADGSADSDADSDFNPNENDGTGKGEKMEVDQPEEKSGNATNSGNRMVVNMASERPRWFRRALSWVKTYLTPGNISPYSILRNNMHISSVHQRRARKRPNMQWVDDNLLLVDQNRFSLPDFFGFVDYQLESLEMFIRDEVLQHHTLADLGIECDFSELKDAGDVDTPGYSCLLPKDGLSNPDSKRFMLKLVQQKNLVSPDRSGGGNLVWDSEKGWPWTGRIREATVRLYALTHILQGSPGRSTEENLMQIANTMAGRRHLFAENEIGTLAIFSDYWKGAKAQGRFKEILRVLPYRISRLLFILIRIVRPVERLFIVKSKLATERGQIDGIYRSKLWSSGGLEIDARVLGDAVSAFFKRLDRNEKKPFGWISGLRPYRHLTVAIQRRRLSGGGRYTKDAEKEGVDVGDLQAGRSTGMSIQNYAVLKSFIPADSGVISHYRAYSMRWHQLFEQSTVFDPTKKYIV